MNTEVQGKTSYAETILIKQAKASNDAFEKTFTLEIAIKSRWTITDPVSEAVVEEIKNAGKDVHNSIGKLFTFTRADMRATKGFLVNSLTQIHSNIV